MAGQEGSSTNKGKASNRYRRPHALSGEKFSDNLFLPRAVSLGPVHHGRKNLLVTKDDKCKIKKVLERKKAGAVYWSEMKDASKKAIDLYGRAELNATTRASYSRDHVFNEMMILDACFIIHAIDYINEGKSEVLEDRPHLLPLILEDMFLLENQVPIIVLKAAMNVLGRKYPQDIYKFLENITQSPEGAPTFWDRLMDLPGPIQFLVFLLFVLITPLMLLVLLVVVLPLALLILLVACLPLGLVGVICLLCFKGCTGLQRGKDNGKEVDPEQPTQPKGSNANEESNEERKGTEMQRSLEQQTKLEGSNENEESNEERKDTENEGDLEQATKKEGSNETEESNEERKGTEMQRDLEQQPKLEGSNENEFHLLHLLRAHLLRCSKKNQPTDTNDNMWRPPRRATELTDAGIKFKRGRTSSVKDVEFEKGFIHGHLYLPSLAQLTETRLVNLMVYELCQGVGGHGITSYVSFLDGLIDCPEDVKELRSTQILPKALGDDQQVTSFFNNVGSFLAPFAYHDVLNEIETHCQSRWRPSTAKFYDKHFSSPWTAVSFLIAILLFAVTIATAYKSFFG